MDNTRELQQFYFKTKLKMWMGEEDLQILFIINHFLLSITLLLSHSYHLEWEEYIFQVLITQFNIEAFNRIILKRYLANSIYFWGYFSSGLFILTNCSLDWILQQHYYSLTFTFHYILLLVFCFYCRQAISCNIIFLLIPYLIELLIFLSFDQILKIDIRYMLIIPLLTFIFKFYQFGRRFVHHVKKHRKKSSNVYEDSVLFDLSVMCNLAYPFCFYFISSSDMPRPSIILTILFHLLVLYRYSGLQPQSRLYCFYLYKIWQCFQKKTQNYYKLAEETKQKEDTLEWELELCSKCNRARANVIFNCGHILFCKLCYLNMRVKKIDKCAFCDQQLLFVYDLIESFGSLLEDEYLKIVKSNSLFYRLFPKINSQTVGLQEAYFFQEGKRPIYLTFTQNQKEQE